ncbi:transcriptional repressor [Aurantimonas sp. MSK8Z-1]|uniref:Fur family transcriptional regulator n=1 Tax=Mangrovibrevibacter kandeliae TaxID=2968473 RepID=UPI0021183AC0|nr:Fur family transcriptional regulator [Aurantimonas sp. MSK8Z-1]MCW4116781.1 transcriptional repressor [Aurantimonas sp. MSK8Z-1]
MSEVKLTRNQGLVFDALQTAEAPLSAYTILDRLRGEGFRAPLQVYRALEKLLALGLVHRLESINAFVACSHPHHDHGESLVAFAICQTCGDVREFAAPAAAAGLRDWAAGAGFKPAKTTIELSGLCQACSAAGA